MPGLSYSRFRAHIAVRNSHLHGWTSGIAAPLVLGKPAAADTTKNRKREGNHDSLGFCLLGTHLLPKRLRALVELKQKEKRECIMLMGKNTRITREQLRERWTTIAMELSPTRTWTPVPYTDFADAVQDTAVYAGLTLVSETYSLSKTGGQFFGIQSYESGIDGLRIALGMRGSVNKTLAEGVIAGSTVVVCDNGLFAGDDFKQVRKNTPNVWVDLKEIICNAVGAARTKTDGARVFRDNTQQIHLGLDRGYELIGKALGCGYVSHDVAMGAMEDWRSPRHEEFRDRTLWSLYNGFTEAVKTVAPQAQMEAHAGARRFTGMVLASER